MRSTASALGASVCCVRPRRLPLRVLCIVCAVARCLGRLQEGWIQQLQPKRGAETVDFLYVKLAHELDRLRVNYLAGDHDRKTWRIRDHKVCRYQRWSFLQAFIDFGTEQLQVLAFFFAICAEECRAHIPFTR